MKEPMGARLGANDVRESGQSEIRLAGSYKIFAVANGWQGWALHAHAVVLVLSPLCPSLQCQYFAAVELCCSSRLSLTLHIPASLPALSHVLACIYLQQACRTVFFTRGRLLLVIAGLLNHDCRCTPERYWIRIPE